MNTRTVLIGIIILVVGIALIAAGAYGILGSATIVTTFNELHTGEYASSELMLNSTSSIVVSSPAATGGIIHAQDLNIVNSTNLSQYAIPYNSSVAGTMTYRSLIGDYYYVAFSSSAPSTRVVATHMRSFARGYGVLAIAGIACFFAGIAVAVIGALRKGKPKKDDTYHHADELLASSPNESGATAALPSYISTLWKTA